MDKGKVLDLAKLARIEIGDSEAEKLSGEFEAILGYVGEVKGVGSKKYEVGSKDKESFALRNVMREDSNPHESGIYTEEILEQAPNSENGYIRVKKIL